MTDRSAPGLPDRQVRLRPEHAGQYPGLEPDVWLPAAGVVDYVLARARTAPRASDPPQRCLNGEHFEFRGGGPRSGTERTRATDT